MTWVTDDNAALLTDLYELTMAASYHAQDMNEPATFDLFVRALPEHRNFLIACGLEGALDYLERFNFDDEAIGYLSSLGPFSDSFLSRLGELTFSGEVRAIAEGEAVFAEEPILSVTAPLIEAQIVESFLLNCITFQTMIASKAARVAISCKGRSFVDFSLRRDHGADAGVKAARAAFVGGAAATSNVLAGAFYGIPVNGTMAHSYVMAHEDEEHAFRTFMKDCPQGTVLIIDTFDVEEGARRAARVAHELAPQGIELRGVRIDSGDLANLTRSVRKILDEADLEQTKIILSGDLDEYQIERLIADEVPVDSFGVGTQLGTSGDQPALGGVYKLVADARGPKMKLSTGKGTLPGRKQVFRVSRNGTLDHDVIGLEDEVADGRPLLDCVMKGGRRTSPPDDLTSVRERCSKSLEALPERLLALNTNGGGYEVTTSPGLKDLIDRFGSHTPPMGSS